MKRSNLHQWGKSMPIEQFLMEEKLNAKLRSQIGCSRHKKRWIFVEEQSDLNHGFDMIRNVQSF